MFKRIFRVIGPGFITASVVLGPGSIVSASAVGANHGTMLLWLLVLALVCMMVYVGISARIGCVAGKPILREVADRYGAWLSILLGVSSFFVCAAFQFGNNLGVATALQEITGFQKLAEENERLKYLQLLWPVLFTAVSILFLFTARNVYAILEKIMIVLVGVMILAFAANLAAIGFDAAGFFKGLVPRIPEGGISTGKALVATSFSVIAALYQAHLVRSKGWKLEDYPTAVRDSRIGIASLGVVTCMIMLTAASAFHGKGVEIRSLGDLARQLETLFGGSAHIIFCAGLAAAALSSFIVNALIGGGLLCDGLGLESSLERPPAKIAASAVLVAGMVVAMAILQMDFNPVRAIVIGQMSTLPAVPLAAIVLLLLSNSKSLMGKHRNGIATNILGGLGLALLLWVCYETVGSLLARLS